LGNAYLQDSIVCVQDGDDAPLRQIILAGLSRFFGLSTTGYGELRIYGNRLSNWAYRAYMADIK